MTVITMTFDNGPDPDVTPHVLDVLRRHEIQSTFFVLGEKLRDRRDVAERAHAEGHWIGNHTFNHLVPLGASAETGIAAREITETQHLIGELAHERRLFRPFGGGGTLDDKLLNSEAVSLLERESYTCVLWNVVPKDWSHPNTWVDRALELCRTKSHAVVVLHDLPTGAMAHLDRFIEAARDRGATFAKDFPTDCVPIECGRRVGPVDRYVSRDA